MININEASYSYKRSLEEQLKKISIKINQGEVILLCGKSGSGKTTITKLINGLIPHFLEGNLLGNIFINGINTKQMKIYEISEKVGTIFQNPKTQFFNLDSDSENYKNLEDEVKPYITMSIENLEEKYKAEDKINPTKTELIDIQKKINEVGFFTETALEDFDNIDKEVSFIKDQVEDLKNSKRDIEKMIVRLEKEMKEEFSKNFAIINRNFTKIFKILFMGGDARLILDSEDFLTAGVEIEAKPPSKSLKSISLLSGGEKALTAVALLFAIFEQNPAPFSILDEIDAALDESNIKRYIDYLKSLSSNTQFIMITHRQTTMQLAEKIHGVTINDEGISKLYSIGFTDN